MKVGRVVVVARDNILTLGSVAGMVPKDDARGEGLLVVFEKNGTQLFYSRASGAIHKIRDYSVEALTADFTGIPQPVPPAPVFSGGPVESSGEFGMGDFEEASEDEEEEDDED